MLVKVARARGRTHRPILLNIVNYVYLLQILIIFVPKVLQQLRLHVIALLILKEGARNILRRRSIVSLKKASGLDRLFQLIVVASSLPHIFLYLHLYSLEAQAESKGPLAGLRGSFDCVCSIVVVVIELSGLD